MATEHMTLPPAARAGDPTTSHAAEAAHTLERVSNLNLVVFDVRQHPGSTGHEIGDRTGLKQHEAMRRLNDARKRPGGPLVVQGPKRVAEGRRLAEVTWWPANVAGEAQML